MNATLPRPGFVMDTAESAWRALLLTTLSRSSEGLIACDERFEVVLATPRATQLLERFGGMRAGQLPCAIACIVDSFAERGDRTITTRVVPEKGSAVQIEVRSLREVPPIRTVLWIRETSLRDEDLYALLHERYGVTMRAFQLTQLVRQGLSNREIARELKLTEATVKAYLHDLFRVYGVSSRIALVALIEDLKNQR